MSRNADTINSLLNFNEEEMANAFQKALATGLPGIGTFDGIYREISCRQGQPDFITLRAPKKSKLTLFNSAGLVSASVLSLLKQASSRRFEYLESNMEYSSRSIKKSLIDLEKSGHVIRTKTGNYILGPAASSLNSEIWAFELKLNNVRRAVFQAQQAKTYTDKTYIVIPPGKDKNYGKYRETLRRWGIGLATFDPLTGAFSISAKSSGSKPISRQFQIYAMSKILAAKRSATQSTKL
jgi:hypothetical protein